MKNKSLALILSLALGIFGGTANAESANAESANAEPVEVDEENQTPREMEMHIGEKSDGKEIELQLEYLSSKPFTERRDMKNYNVHFFQKSKQVHAMSIYYGLTVTRATGYNIPRGIAYDSNGVGVGPAMLLRWEKQLSGKLHGSIDFSGSFMLYNRAHPYDGRAYGFLWRLGPRLIWKYDDRNSFSVGYNISHFSNAMRKHNPGYNTMGLSIGLNHEF